MTKYQMNQMGEARAALAKGLEIEEKELPHLDSGDLGSEWLDWIMGHALMSEAKALLRDPSPHGGRAGLEMSRLVKDL